MGVKLRRLALEPRAGFSVTIAATDICTSPSNLPHVIARNVISTLVQTAVVAPAVVLIVFGAGRLLASMGDATGGVWLSRLAVLGGLIWTIDLVLLLLALGINASKPPDGTESER